MTDEKEKEVDLPSFFSKKDRIGLIALIDREDGDIVKGIEEKIDYTRRQLSTILEDAEKLDLIEETNLLIKDHPRSIRYKLTEKGKEIQSLFQHYNLDELYEEYMEAKRAFEKEEPKAHAHILAQFVSHGSQESWSSMERLSEEEAQRIADQIAEESEDTAESPEIEDIPQDVRQKLLELDDRLENDEDKGRTETWGTEEDLNEDS